MTTGDPGYKTRETTGMPPASSTADMGNGQSTGDAVKEKASQVADQAQQAVSQVTDKAQQQARMVRDKYNEFQERTGIEITPRMLGIAAGALAGLVALIALIQRLRGRNAEEEDEVIIAEITPATLSNGKYQITRIED